MGIAYKNFWSLNVDETMVIGILRYYFPKHIEVLIPVNAQLKDVDLAVINLKNNKSITLQVKGSRAYEPSKNEVAKFGAGSNGWFFFKKKVIDKCTADYFIFIVEVLTQSKKDGRKYIEPHIITVPTRKLKNLCRKNKLTHGDRMYSFLFWINPQKKEAFDRRDKKYYVTEYLDKKGVEKLIRETK